MESRLLIPPEQRMEESFRIPIVATLVFILTMVAVFYLGRQVSGYYQPVFEGGGVAFEERA
ncbi:MAG: hypothetical protein COV99_04355 [Bacteroidetes bacterium CG12_big_fil_rev_8_21_14_0_65_60_17]|nr:MAG: hypothetical protein COV99_04355 [Bacteroidetes bacterium CG12_big_fil_rev_8_21_14_0_65_60_17]